MHELSIAQSIVQLAEQEAQKYHALQITEIELEIGVFSSIEIQALMFALEFAVKDSLLEKADIIYLPIEGKGECRECESDFLLKSLFSPCPNCGSYNIQIVNGKELRIKSICIK